MCELVSLQQAHEGGPVVIPISPVWTLEAQQR